MKVLLKYSDQLSSKSSLNIDIELTSLIKDVRIRISRILDLPLSSFHLFTKRFGVQIMLTDTWPLSFFLDDENSKIKLKLLDLPVFHRKDSNSYSFISSNASSFQRFSYSINPFDQAILHCKNNNLEELKNFLEQYKSPDEELLHSTEESQWGLIHYACLAGSSEIVAFLVSKLVNCNKVTIDEWTPLQLACYFNHTNCVYELVKYQNLQINKKTKFRGTALHIACESGNVEVVKILLQRFPVLGIEDHRRKTPIELATKEEIFEIIAIYSGQEELKKCMGDQKVTSFGGDVFFVNTFCLSDKLVFLYMDIENAVINRYQRKEEFLDKKIPRQVIKILDIQTVDLDLKRKFQYYFTLETSESSVKFYTKHEEMTKEWADRIKKAIEYCMIHKQNSIAGQLKEQKEIFYETDSTKDSSLRLSQADNEIVDFSSFTIIKEIGNGSFGIVYKVAKINSGAIYAMKSLSKAVLQRQKQLKYAISECKIMQQLNHPFIVPLHFAFETPKHLYLILELCPNGDLSDLIQKRGKLDEAFAKFYLAEVILALEYLHNLGIIYRDLKPANILIDNEFHAKLADFGLAKEKTDSKNPAMSMAGTPAYLAPEIVAKKGATAATDIYGLGPLLYELLTGMTPYYDEDVAMLFQNIKNSKLSFPSHLSAQAKDFITLVMNKDPNKRPQLSQIKRHQFFWKMDWETLLARKIRPPK